MTIEFRTLEEVNEISTLLLKMNPNLLMSCTLSSYDFHVMSDYNEGLDDIFTIKKESSHLFGKFKGYDLENVENFNRKDVEHIILFTYESLNKLREDAVNEPNGALVEKVPIEPVPFPFI